MVFGLGSHWLTLNLQGFSVFAVDLSDLSVLTSRVRKIQKFKEI